MATLDHTKILMIHIPRNACISIPWMALNEDGSDEENPAIHAVRDDIQIPLDRFRQSFDTTKSRYFGKFETLQQMKSRLNISQYIPITICRNPFTRTYSLYVKYLQISNLLKIDKSYLNFLQSIKQNKPFHIAARNLVNKTQSSWISSEDGTIDNSVRVYRFENLEQFKNDLGVARLDNSQRLKYDDITEFDPYPKISENSPAYNNLYEAKLLLRKYYIYNTEEFLANYSNECKILVQELFAEDFANFGYSTNFDDCL